MGNYLEEFEVGRVYPTRARTITETDVVTFGCLTGDFHDNHFNGHRMEQSEFGQRIAHGLLVLSYCNGMFNQTGLFQDTCTALLGVEEWKFMAPVFFGDTIRCDAIPEEIIPSRSKPDRGVMKLRFQIYNQNDVLCQSGIMVVMMKRKPD